MRTRAGFARDPLETVAVADTRDMKQELQHNLAELDKLADPLRCMVLANLNQRLREFENSMQRLESRPWDRGAVSPHWNA